MKNFLKEFETFALKGNFIDLAVGVVVGAAFNNVTNSLVNNVITPPLGLIIGRVKFEDLAIPLGGTANIQYGLFIQSLITFFITAFVLFLVIRTVNRLRALAFERDKNNKEAPATPQDSPEVQILKEIRDALKSSN